MTRSFLTDLLRRPYRRWRGSLQLRVVTSTLVASAIVVAVLGVVLFGQLTDGLLEAKRNAALAETNAGLSTAENALAEATSTLTGTNADIEANLACALAETTRSSSAGTFDVFVQPSTPNRSGCGPRDIDASSIPAALVQRVADEGVQASTYTTIASLDPSVPDQPGLVIGAPISSGLSAYQVYYLFPLDSEIETLSLVRQILTLAGIVLVLLLAGIAALVTRQVVRPVRLAARTAGRLADGLLHERIAVRGEDDLGRLATSFNDMAVSLQRQIVRLEELSRVQRRFVSDVSHELRTPLTTVRMAADVLHDAREDFPAPAARSAELLQAELDRFESLLADLLEISRYDAGAADLEPTEVDLRELVQRCAAAYQLLAERRGSDLVLQLPPEPVMARLDTRRIERVLRNLLGNAIEHGEGLPVEILVAGDEDAVAVVVRDHGIGLRPGEAGLVFNRFWRGDPSRARLTGGTGLGLAIALEDARLHGGWLQAYGEIGRGAAFRLTLPRRAGAPVRDSPLPLDPGADRGTLTRRGPLPALPPLTTPMEASPHG